MQAYQHKYDPNADVVQMAVAHALAKKNEKKPSVIFQLMDNREDSVAQLKTKIVNKSQPYYYEEKNKPYTVPVGKEMEAWLDPDDPKKGWSSNLNTAQTPMMKALKKEFRIPARSNSVVKGHLLNDNLGGTALNKNLYPISAAANNDHLNYVENKVKSMLWEEKRGVYYRVLVSGDPRWDEPRATFECHVSGWDPKTDSKGDVEIANRHINSDLNKLDDYGSAEDVEAHYFRPTRRYSASRIGMPTRPSDVSTYTRVRDLDADSVTRRKLDYRDQVQLDGNDKLNRKNSIWELNPFEQMELLRESVSPAALGSAAVGGIGYGAYAAATATAGTTGSVLAGSALMATGIGAAAGAAGYGIYKLVSGKLKQD